MPFLWRTQQCCLKGESNVSWVSSGVDVIDNFEVGGLRPLLHHHISSHPSKPFEATRLFLCLLESIEKFTFKRNPHALNKSRLS